MLPRSLPAGLGSKLRPPLAMLDHVVPSIVRDHAARTARTLQTRKKEDAMSADAVIIGPGTGQVISLRAPRCVC